MKNLILFNIITRGKTGLETKKMCCTLKLIMPLREYLFFLKIYNII